MVSFADVGKEEQSGKSDIIRSHLVSRATENAMYVLSANSTSQHQLAPTCVIDPDGNVIDTAPLNEEYLLTAEIEITEPGFGRGRKDYPLQSLNGFTLSVAANNVSGSMLLALPRLAGTATIQQAARSLYEIPCCPEIGRHSFKQDHVIHSHPTAHLIAETAFFRKTQFLNTGKNLYSDGRIAPDRPTYTRSKPNKVLKIVNSMGD